MTRELPAPRMADGAVHEGLEERRPSSAPGDLDRLDRHRAVHRLVGVSVRQQPREQLVPGAVPAKPGVLLPHRLPRPELRRKSREGVGRALMQAAEDAVRARGAPSLGVAVTVINNSARRFYDRLGYRDWGGGPVCDEWDEYDGERVLVSHHADACAYLIKNI